MASGLELRQVLIKTLDTKNVYYQPPKSTLMAYPAIVYTKSSVRNKYADDSVYKKDNAYDLTVISTDPDESLVDKVASMSLCRFDRTYVKDNLYHTVFTLYF